MLKFQIHWDYSNMLEICDIAEPFRQMLLDYTKIVEKCSILLQYEKNLGWPKRTNTYLWFSIGLILLSLPNIKFNMANYLLSKWIETFINQNVSNNPFNFHKKWIISEPTIIQTVRLNLFKSGIYQSPPIRRRKYGMHKICLRGVESLPVGAEILDVLGVGRRGVAGAARKWDP